MNTPQFWEANDDVARAVADGQPTVALESTIFSDLGLPPPHNRHALSRTLTAVRNGGAVPALTAVLDGRARVGVDSSDHERICGPTRKTTNRELAVAIAQAWPYGATTVSASVTLAAAAGIPVFATGGIGGVHRGAERTGDISADLEAIARHRVITVTAGAKAFLDLPRTLEYLETAGVPVVGWQCDEFPAFYARSSGLRLAARADTVGEIVAVAEAHWSLGGGGLVIACPVPEGDAIAFDELSNLVDEALLDTGELVSGAAVTPAVLARLTELSDGRTLDANLSLAEHNAQIAAEIAVALMSTSDRT